MTATVEKEGDRILLFVDYYAGVNADCKKVNGYKFEADAPNKPWSYPLSMQTCHALRAVWGDKLEIGPRLWAWSRLEITKARRRGELARQKDNPLHNVKVIDPELWEAMSGRSYQRSGAAFLATNKVKDGALASANCDEMGLGKTVEMLAAVMEAGLWDGRHLVICPKTAIKSTWMEQIEGWTDARVYPMPEGRRQREKVFDAFWDDEEPGARFLVILPHMLQIKVEPYCKKCKLWAPRRSSFDDDFPTEHWSENHKTTPSDRKIEWPELFEYKWDSILADEAHDYLLKLRPPSAANQPQWAHGMRRLRKCMAPNGLRIAATGTPFRGDPAKIFGILHWLDPKTYGSSWGFYEAFFEVERVEHNRDGATHKTVGKLRKDAEQKFYQMLDTMFLRRTRKEVRSDLPENLPIEVWVEMEGEHARQYRQFEKESVLELESGVIEGLGTLSEMVRLRQLSFGQCEIKTITKSRKVRDPYTGRFVLPVEKEDYEVLELHPIVKKSPKVEWLLGMLKEMGIIGEYAEGTSKVIIVSQSVRVLDGLHEMFQEMRVATLILKGKVTASKRDVAASSFQKDPAGPRVLLLQTKTGGVSLTLDRYCDVMVFFDESWIDDDQRQVMGRIDNRQGDPRPRTFYFVRTKETVEEGVAIRNADQADIQNQLLDGRRGVETALSILRRGA